MPTVQREPTPQAPAGNPPTSCTGWVVSPMSAASGWALSGGNDPIPPRGQSQFRAPRASYIRHAVGHPVHDGPAAATWIARPAVVSVPCPRRHKDGDGDVEPAGDDRRQRGPFLSAGRRTAWVARALCAERLSSLDRGAVRLASTFKKYQAHA